MRNKPIQTDTQALNALLEEAAALPRQPRLLLHACCGPCSTAVLERLGRAFSVTLYYYNPNTFPREEYLRRLEALETVRLARPEAPELVTADYDHGEFLTAAAGMEALPEGGARCTACWELRLRRTAELAAGRGFEFFGSTLTLGPTKDARRINAIGKALEAEFGVRWLRADFKKGGGYARSLELSRELALYRQNYCGCEFARRDA